MLSPWPAKASADVDVDVMLLVPQLRFCRRAV